MKKIITLFFLMIILTTGCKAEFQKSGLPPSPLFSISNTPTITISPFLSPTSTSTPTPTFTSTPTSTFTFTATPVPEPVVINAQNISELKLVHRNLLFPNGVLRSAYWSPDGEYLVVLTNLGFDLLEGASLELISHMPDQTPLFFMEDGRLLMQDKNSTASFLNLKTGDISSFPYEVPLNEAGLPVTYAISPDGSTLALADQPNMIKIVNLSTAEEREFTYFLKENVIFYPYAMKFAPDNNQLFMMISRNGGRSELLVFDISKDELTHEIFSKDGFPVFSPDKKRMVFPPGDFVSLIIPETLAEWSSHSYWFPSIISDEESAFYSGMAFSFLKDSQRVGVLYSGDVTNRSKKQLRYITTLLIYNTASGKVERFLNELPSRAFDFGFSPDGSRFFTLSNEGIIQLWQTEDGSQITVSNNYEPSESIVISPDGSKIAYPLPGGVRVVNADDGQVITQFSPYEEANSWSTWVSFAGNDIIAVSFYSTYRTQTDTYNLITTEMIRRYPELIGCEFNIAGNVMICDSSEDLELFDSETGRILLQFHTTFDPTKISFYFAVSDDGSYTAYCTPGSETVYLWDTYKGTQIRYLRDKNRPVCGAMDFSDDNDLIVSSSGTVWQLPEGDVFLNLTSQNFGMVVISPSNDFVVINPEIFSLSDGNVIGNIPETTGRLSQIFFNSNGLEMLMLTDRELQHWAVLK